MAQYIKLFLNATSGAVDGTQVSYNTDINPITTSPLRNDAETISTTLDIGIRCIDPAAGSASYTTDATTFLIPGIQDNLTVSAANGATQLSVSYPQWFTGHTSANARQAIIAVGALSAEYTVTSVDTSAGTIIITPGLSAAVAISGGTILQKYYSCWAMRKTSADSWGAWGSGLQWSAGVVKNTNTMFQIQARSVVGETLAPDTSVSMNYRCSAIVLV